MSGKIVLQQTGFFSQGRQRVLLSGISAGIYCLEIKSAQYLYSAKLISSASFPALPAEINMEPSGGPVSGPYVQGPLATTNPGGMSSLIYMQFNAGDTLKLTGKSGNCRTVSMLFPNQSQAVTFNFVQCTDADSNHYAVVQIGTQLWMQENLKTTRYRDGTVIPNVTDSATWGNLSTGAWCDYHNLPSEGEVYGHLYNYYAVADTRNICP